MTRLLPRAPVLLAALFGLCAGCGGDAAMTGGDASATVDGGLPDGRTPDGGGLGDGALPDGGVSCGAAGMPCTSSASCCVSLLCDDASHTCTFLSNVCAPVGGACTVATDCCTLRCTAGQCGPACAINGQACTAAGDCCSGNCVAGSCAPVVAGCATTGNPCAAGADCCTANCQGGLCAPAGGGCLVTGDTCYRAADCCAGSCTQPNGPNSAGTCTAIHTGGSGGCAPDGEPCTGCGGCCSHVCIPTATGGQVCAAAGGCRVVGDLCHQDSDCCGGGATGLPGANNVTCNIAAGTNPPVGTCSNPNGCDPDGDVCGLALGTNTCGNARHDCCDCLPPKINCCKFDPAGVPRCYGGSTPQCPSGYTGTPPCCINAGDVCAFSAECCGGAPCLPDASGVLRCGSSCSPPTGPCRADADCCVGLVCNIPNGQLDGTCGSPPVRPPATDGGAQAPDGGPPATDGGAPAPDGGNLCSQVGQSCSTTQPCCSGLICTPPSGIGPCAAGQTGCTCFGTIG